MGIKSRWTNVSVRIKCILIGYITTIITITITITITIITRKKKEGYYYEKMQSLRNEFITKVLNP